MYWHFITALFLHTVFPQVSDPGPSGPSCLLTVAVCPNGWQRHEQSCYLFSRGLEYWPGAYEMCKIMGGGLVEIETADENTFLHQQVKNSGHLFWIGLSDASEEGNWVWMTSMTSANHQFTKWSPGEPSSTDIANTPENCVDLYPTGYWNDAPCTALRYYICEKRDVQSKVVG